MKFNTSLKLKSNIIDPVPFITVMALLVLFFMLAVNFLGKNGVIVDLPHVEQAELYKLDSAVVTLLSDKILLFDNEIDSGKLQEELTKRNPQLLAIKADKNISYNKIAEVIALAKHVGIKQIAIAVDK